MTDLKLHTEEPDKKDHEMFVLPDESGQDRNLLLEVNWNDSVRPMKKIRLKDEQTGQSYIIDRDQLMTVMFALADEVDQMAFVNQKVATVDRVERHYEVVLQRDYRKGEKMLVKLPWTEYLQALQYRPIRRKPTVLELGQK